MVFKDAGFGRCVTLSGNHSWVFKLLLNNGSLNFMARDGLPSRESLIRETPEASKPVLAVASALDCPLELDSKTLLPKVPYTLTEAHEDIQLELNWKLPLCLLDFIVPEGSIQAAGGKQSYLAVDPANSTTNTGQGVPSSATVACLLGE